MAVISLDKGIIAGQKLDLGKRLCKMFSEGKINAFCLAGNLEILYSEEFSEVKGISKKLLKEGGFKDAKPWQRCASCSRCRQDVFAREQFKLNEEGICFDCVLSRQQESVFGGRK